MWIVPLDNRKIDSVKINNLIQAKDVNALKRQGSYVDVKAILESTLGLKLGVKGWASLHHKLTFLQQAVRHHEDALRNASKSSFSRNKQLLVNSLKLKIKVKNQTELERVVQNLLQYFAEKSFDPNEYFERTKIQNFAASSKLEGMSLPLVDQTQSLDDVLAKYRVAADG